MPPVYPLRSGGLTARRRSPPAGRGLVAPEPDALRNPDDIAVDDVEVFDHVEGAGRRWGLVVTGS